MIHLHYNSALDEKIAAMRAGLKNYLVRLNHVVSEGGYSQSEASINLPVDARLLVEVQQLAVKKVTPRLKYHIVVGIGGSNLGAKAIYDALLGYDDVIESVQYPKLIFVETVDADFLQAIVKMIGKLELPDQVLVSVISKSGGTTETIANFEIVTHALTGRFGEQSLQRVVVITDDDSELWRAAQQKNIDRLSIPRYVGGRYSVFSAAGLFPLETVGIDTVELLQGALEMRDKCLADGEHCVAMTSACLLNYYRLQSKSINDNFIFSPRLESVGKWYRQLIAESIGKQKDLSDQDVYVGITPIVSIGSTDLHSVGQLYLGGPKDKFTTFVSVDDETHLDVPAERLLPQITPMINQKSAQEIMHAILDGTMAAYQKANLPYVHVALDEINAHDLGAYLQFKMIEVMYLAQLMNVNAFDQPNVDLYKIETKNILENEV
ncbi:MAG: hypothetical protein PVI21_05995 [Candidatus Woesebacteria bacterium]|jgi:glucose-6-phosphate isomerase